MNCEGGPQIEVEEALAKPKDMPIEERLFMPEVRERVENALREGDRDVAWSREARTPEPKSLLQPMTDPHIMHDNIRASMLRGGNSENTANSSLPNNE